MKVLLIEDDQDLAALLSATFSQNNCVVDTATDGEMGIDMANQWEYDVILLDLGLPKRDGIAVCRQLRQQGCATPILMLTAQSSTEDIVRGLDTGADDYVTKPFDPQQVLARLRALQRRQTPAVSSNILTWGELEFDTHLTQVTCSGHEISLSPKEYALLELFLRNPKRVFSRPDVIDKLWTIDDCPSEATVTNLVKDLRRKLRQGQACLDPIETLHGMGYRLKAPPTVSEIAPPPQEVSQPPSLATSQSSEAATQEMSVEQLARKFKARLESRMANLYAMEAALAQRQLTASLQERACMEAHKLVGSLGTFGYPQGSDIIRAIEHLLMSPFPLSPEQGQHLTSLFRTLQEILACPPNFQAFPKQEKGVRRILVIDADACFTAELQALIADLPITLVVAPDHATAYHRLADTPPDGVVINLGATAPREATLTWLADLNLDFPEMPVLVLADQDTLDNRTAVTAYRVQRFVSKPIRAMELIAIITQMLAEAHAHTPTAMVVDDDPTTLEILSGLLLSQGIQTTCLLNAVQFWDFAKVVHPAILLLDLEMPEINGIELCKTVRQDARYRDLPILMITAHTDDESIQGALAAGADDVLPKPIRKAMLMTRIHQYLNRHRLYP